MSQKHERTPGTYSLAEIVGQRVDDSHLAEATDKARIQGMLVFVSML